MDYNNIDIEHQLHEVTKTLPENVTLVAISKYHHPDLIMQAYNAGQRVFGESREQEMTRKHDELPTDIQWHFIGHLQTNKVRYIAPYVSLIHSVDSLKLLKEIDKQGKKFERIIHVLLEAHVAAEETKSGLTPSEMTQLLEEGTWRALSNVHIDGIMGMATNTDDQQRIEKDFESLRLLYQQIKQRFFASDEDFKTLSMGMSADYRLALKHDTTMVRVGTAIFGPRQY